MTTHARYRIEDGRSCIDIKIRHSSQLFDRRDPAPFREHVRRGQMILGVGITVLVVFLTLAELTVSLSPGPLREILREGLVITGWVAMWRPLEVLLYDWWPIVDERRRITRILEAPVSIRYDAEAVPAAGGGSLP